MDRSSAYAIGHFLGSLAPLAIGIAVSLYLRKKRGEDKLPGWPIIIGLVLTILSCAGATSSRAAAAALVSASAAEATLLHGVLTDCTNPDKPVLRMLPGEDARIAGDTYAPLSQRDATLARWSADQLIGASPPKTAAVHVVYFSGTETSGEQWRKAGTWPISEIRRLARDCSSAAAQSLGQRDGTTFAFVDVACPRADTPWERMRIGIGIARGEVSTLCVNVGDPAAVQFTPETKQERG